LVENKQKTAVAYKSAAQVYKNQYEVVKEEMGETVCSIL